MDEDRATSEKADESILIAEKQEVLFAELVRQLYSNAPIGMLATAINSLALVAIERNIISKGRLIAWLTLLALISVPRYIEIRRFRRASLGHSEAKRWGRRFIVGLALSGMAWGSAGIFLFPIESIVHQTFLTFVIGGMVAGAAASFSALPKAFFAYSVPALTPIIVRFCLLGDELHLAMAGMVLLFGLMMVFIAMRVNALTVASLKLRFENSGLVLVGQQFIELKRVKKILQESEERFRQIAENIREVFWMADSDLTKMIYVSPTYEEIWGRKTVELYNNPKSWMDAIHPEDRERVEENLPLRGMGGFAVEYRIISPDGVVRWIWDRAFAVRNEGGEVYRIAGIAEDITERKRIEMELKAAAEKYSTLFNTTSDGVWIHNLNGQILEVNDAYCRMSGYSREELTHKPISGLEAVETSGEIANHIKKLIEKGGHDRFESRHRRKDGSIFDVDITAFYFGREGGRIGIFVRDITERKQMEEDLRRSRDELEIKVQERTAELAGANKELQEEMARRERAEQQLRQAQKMEAIGRLTGGIAHDFNNILGAIVINSELALFDVPVGSGVRTNLDLILKSGLRGKDLVRQMLLFSRKSEKKQEIITLTPLIKETFKLLRSSIPTTIQMELLLETESDAVSADPSQIQQVIMNLCTNAAYAMRGTTGSIDISLQNITFGSTDLPEADMQPGDYLVLSVKDTGSGMDEEVRKRIFEPFFTTKPFGEGTGLGLSVVYGIVKNHKGGITVDSEPGKGSIFRVYLPKVDIGPSVATETLKPILRGNERILFVDDEEIIVQSVRNMLEHLGYKVTALLDSQEALELFSSNPSEFDLVITDQTMPFMTGEDLGKELMRIRPDTPVILCTGHSDSISSEKAMAMGFRGFIMKPFSVREGAELVRRVLDQKEPSNLRKNP